MHDWRSLVRPQSHHTDNQLLVHRQQHWLRLWRRLIWQSTTPAMVRLPAGLGEQTAPGSPEHASCSPPPAPDMGSAWPLVPVGSGDWQGPGKPICCLRQMLHALGANANPPCNQNFWASTRPPHAAAEDCDPALTGVLQCSFRHRLSSLVQTKPDAQGLLAAGAAPDAGAARRAQQEAATGLPVPQLCTGSLVSGQQSTGVALLWAGSHACMSCTDPTISLLVEDRR